MIKKILLSLSLLTASSALSALDVGETLPAVSINDRGELLLEEKTIAFDSWSIDELDSSKTNIIMYLAGRMSSDKMIRPFTDALEAENISLDKIHSTTIVNLDDSLWGTTGFVISEVKSNKQEHPEVTFVLEESGETLKKWQLDEGSAAIIILTNKGEIAYLKQGAFDDAEAKNALAVLKKNLP
ncbi:putative protein YtfJ [Sinobacterium norvegicum]|uniref:YtfJ family protein n=1 Tax=Sinobacterium norvegicum TaxID=1641715 RepID=A0ABM9ABD1_9GAMM|nr:YtfJ family protein [Sinobacterium norvegicum]CAH0990511.1 putative protein YtfJ [Sinobacterium norvegicum]